MAFSIVLHPTNPSFAAEKQLLQQVLGKQRQGSHLVQPFPTPPHVLQRVQGQAGALVLAAQVQHHAAPLLKGVDLVEGHEGLGAPLPLKHLQGARGSCCSSAQLQPHPTEISPLCPLHSNPSRCLGFALCPCVTTKGLLGASEEENQTKKTQNIRQPLAVHLPQVLTLLHPVLPATCISVPVLRFCKLQTASSCLSF